MHETHRVPHAHGQSLRDASVNTILSNVASIAALAQALPTFTPTQVLGVVRRCGRWRCRDGDREPKAARERIELTLGAV